MTGDHEPTPASAGWHEGDPPGNRLFLDLGPLRLESGAELPGVRVAYETFGTPRRDAAGEIINACLIEHALTADSHVGGDATTGHPQAGWWGALVGDGLGLDTGRGGWWVICANVLGGCQGTTGPASITADGSAWGSRWPVISIRDQVEVERRLTSYLGIGSYALVLGASMGGMRALEWAIAHPAAVQRLGLIAAPSESGADAIAATSAQLAAITNDPYWYDGDYHDEKPGSGPHRGLGLARKLAHITYRSRAELEERFGRETQPNEPEPPVGRFAVESYLDHHADKLARRFDAGSYVTLAQTMNGHDVGRGRGGVEAALAAISAACVIVAVDSDRLYPPCEQERIANGITGASLTTIQSLYGHDGFLLEVEKITAALGDLLIAPAD